MMMTEEKYTILEVVQIVIDELQKIIDDVDTITLNETCISLATQIASLCVALGQLTNVESYTTAVKVAVILREAEDMGDAFQAMMN